MRYGGIARIRQLIMAYWIIKEPAVFFVTGVAFAGDETVVL
jgi:hypothetical protein